MSLPVGFKPMLSATLVDLEDAKNITYPCYVSAKIDGIRCVTDCEGTPYSRNGTPLQNQYLVQEIGRLGLSYVDGELGVGDPWAPEFFNTTSGLARRKFDDNFETLDYYLFDSYVDGGYEERWINRQIITGQTGKINIIKLPQKKVLDEDMLKGWEEYYVEQGYEGLMVRSKLAAPYKRGRATMRSGELIKFKRFVTDEMVITGFVEAMENLNEKQEDAFGRTKRSSHQENKIGKGMAGVILGTCENFDGEVRIGTGLGLNHALRTDMYNHPEKYIGKVITFAYQGGGDYEKTRFGSFKGFRDAFDMDAVA